MVGRLDLRLCLVTDPILAGEQPLSRIVAAALSGGVTSVQLRDKHSTPRAILETGAEILSLTRRHDIALILNDRVDLALALEADGVHIGPQDLPPLSARRLMPKPLRMGVSAGTVQEAQAAAAAGADYLGVGPVYATTSKSDARAVLGPEGLASIAREVAIPVVGIGGIRPGNAADVVAAGAAGVAVLSALVGSPDPAGTAEQIRREVDQALRQRGRATTRKEGSE